MIRRWRGAAILLLAALFSLLPHHPADAQRAETLVSGTVRVVHAPGQRAMARRVATLARTPFAMPGLGRRAIPDSTTIVLAPTPAAFRAATGGGVPEWAGGVAIPETRTIVLPTYAAAGVRQEQAVVLRHEIAHLVLEEQVRGPIPRWFHEGYAEVAAGGWDVQSAWQLRVAFVLGGVPPLDSLELGWPRGAEQARFAYLLSATAVDYLHRRSGDRGMQVFFRNWNQEGDFDAAMRATFALTLGQFEEDWANDVKRRYGWLLGLSNLAVIWFAAAVLALIAWIPRRRRNRRRMEEMRKEERMLPPPRPDGLNVEYPLPEPPD